MYGNAQGTSISTYGYYKHKKQGLIDLAIESRELLCKIKDIEAVDDSKIQLYLKNINEHINRLQSKNFKVQVIGSFKNGKSTFINALLGEEILPSYAVPCTAVINEVKYGDEKKALLHFCSPLPQKLLSSIPEKIKKHMQRHYNNNVPPTEVPYDELEDYVVIPTDMTEKVEEYNMESPYSKVELFYPKELLKNGVEIVDSPGLNEHRTRTEVTTKYLSQADAIIFLLDATKPCSADELDFIENRLLKQGYDMPFFIVNRYDQVRERERARLKQYVNNRLKPLFGDNLNVFYVSSLDALEGREDYSDSQKDKQEALKMIEDSGILELEESLSRFLTEERGRTNLLLPAKDIEAVLNEVCDKSIPNCYELLNTSLDDVIIRYNNMKPELERMINKKDQLTRNLCDDVNNFVNTELREFIRDYFKLLRKKICSLIKDYKSSNFEKNTSLFSSDNAVNQATEELYVYLINAIENDILAWEHGPLNSFVAHKCNNIFGQAQDLLKFVKKEISGICKYDADTISMLKNTKYEYEKSDGPSLFLMGALGMVGVLTFGFSTVIATVALGGGIIKKLSVASQIKFNAEQEFTKRIKSNADQYEEMMVKRIEDALYSNIRNLLELLDAEIQETKGYLERIIVEKKQGEANVLLQKRKLEEVKTELLYIRRQLDDYTSSVK